MVLSGREKATILLSILGSESSGKVLRYLPDEIADNLAGGLDSLPTPSAETLEEVLGEFQNFVNKDKMPKNKPEFPPELPKIEDDIPKIENKKEPLPPPPPPKPSTPIEILETADPVNLASAFLKERSQMIAFVLSNIKKDSCDKIIAQLPGQRDEIELWLDHMEKNKFSEIFKKSLIKHFSDKVL